MQALPSEWEISPSDNTADVPQLYKEVIVHFDVIGLCELQVLTKKSSHS